MKNIYALGFVILIAALCDSQSIRAEEKYNFSFKNKSSQPVQIELIQQLNPISKLTAVAVGDMFTAAINIKEPTKMFIYYCPETDPTWCKKNKPEKMTVRFTPRKPIHISFDGKKVFPQLKRFNNIGSGDIGVIK